MGSRWRRSGGARCEIKTIGAIWWRCEDGAQGGGVGVMRLRPVVRQGREWCWWITRLRPAAWTVSSTFGGGDIVVFFYGGLLMGYGLRWFFLFIAEDEGEWWVLRWVLFVWGYWKGCLLWRRHRFREVSI